MVTLPQANQKRVSTIPSRYKKWIILLIIKETTMATVLDIEGAFSNTLYTSMIRKLQETDVKP